MSKISKVFEKGKVFIPFVTCGDPDLETTAEVVLSVLLLKTEQIWLNLEFRFLIPLQKDLLFRKPT